MVALVARLLEVDDPGLKEHLAAMTERQRRTGTEVVAESVLPCVGRVVWKEHDVLARISLKAEILRKGQCAASDTVEPKHRETRASENRQTELQVSRKVHDCWPSSKIDSGGVQRFIWTSNTGCQANPERAASRVDAEVRLEGVPRDLSAAQTTGRIVRSCAKAEVEAVAKIQPAWDRYNRHRVPTRDGRAGHRERVTTIERDRITTIDRDRVVNRDLARDFLRDRNGRRRLCGLGRGRGRRGRRLLRGLLRGLCRCRRKHSERERSGDSEVWNCTRHLVSSHSRP